jgi:hypothetical protein
MLHGKQAVYLLADLKTYLADPQVSGFPPDQPLPDGLTTLADWAATIDRSPATVRGWIAERYFPAPAGRRGRQRVYSRAELDEYVKSNPWAAAIGRSPPIVQAWSRMPGFPRPVGMRGAQRVYRRRRTRLAGLLDRQSAAGRAENQTAGRRRSCSRARFAITRRRFQPTCPAGSGEVSPEPARSTRSGCRARPTTSAALTRAVIPGSEVRRRQAI